MDKSLASVQDDHDLAEEKGAKNDLLSLMDAVFPMGKWDPNGFSGLPLAFIGDGIYELIIRTLILNKGNTQVKKIHNRRAEFVNAGTQSRLIQAIHEELTEEEQNICRRGRNTKPHTKAKNASVEDYMWATGLEALCGWLYLQGRMERLLCLIGKGLEAIGYDLKSITGVKD